MLSHFFWLQILLGPGEEGTEEKGGAKTGGETTDKKWEMIAICG